MGTHPAGADQSAPIDRPRRVSGLFCSSPYIAQLGLLGILTEIRKWLNCSHISDRQAVVFKSLETCMNKDESTSRHLKPVHASSRCTCYKRLNLSRHRHREVSRAPDEVQCKQRRHTNYGP